MLRDHGPALGRPTVDSIQASRLTNLKELRASSSWYRQAIPEAERLYAQHVETMKRSNR